MDKMGIEKDTKELIYLISERKLAPFVGSGISLFSPSNLPTGNQLRDSILDALADVTPELRTQISFIKKKNPSPELVYQIVYDHIGNFFYKKCLDVLKRNQTNSNHFLLAALAKKKYLNTIVTTNFDYLLERALKEQNIDFSVYYNEKGFKRYLSKRNKDCVAIIKLHGTIQHKRSVISTSGETSRGLSPYQTQILNKLVKEQYLLFIGYSGNDIDIFPKILNMADTAKGIYWNFRSKASISEQIQRLFNAYKDRATPIIKDLRDLLEQVAEELKIPYVKPDLSLAWSPPQREVFLPTMPHPKPDIPSSWGMSIKRFTHLERWAALLTGDESVRSSIIAKLSYDLGDYDIAIYCWRELVRLSEDKAAKSTSARTYYNIGRAYFKKEQWEEAIEHYYKSLKISEKSKDIRLLAEIYFDLGLIFGRKGQGDKAVEHFQKSLGISMKLSDAETIAMTFNNLGTVYKNKKQWDEAIYYYEKCLRYTKKIKDTETLSIIYTNLEAVYENKGEYDNAIKYSRKNKELSDRLKGIEYKDIFLGAAPYNK